MAGKRSGNPVRARARAWQWLPHVQPKTVPAGQLRPRELPLHTPVTVAGSTLVAAALFSPLRRRVQKVVDRRFNWTRHDAELVVAAFAVRLQDATDLHVVQADLAGTVDRALEPVHLPLWSGHISRMTRPDRDSSMCGATFWRHIPLSIYDRPGIGWFRQPQAEEAR